MHRIDSRGGATLENMFTEGDPASAIPPTVLSADWCNAVQEEMAQIRVSPHSVQLIQVTQRVEVVVARMLVAVLVRTAVMQLPVATVQVVEADK